MVVNLPIFTSVGSIGAVTPVAIFAGLGVATNFINLKTLLLLNRSDVVLWVANSAAACVAGGANAYPLEPESAGYGSGGSLAIDCEYIPRSGELYVIAASGVDKRLGVVFGTAL